MKLYVHFFLLLSHVFHWQNVNVCVFVFCLCFTQASAHGAASRKSTENSTLTCTQLRSAFNGEISTNTAPRYTTLYNLILLSLQTMNISLVHDMMKTIPWSPFFSLFDFWVFFVLQDMLVQVKKDNYGHFIWRCATAATFACN